MIMALIYSKEKMFSQQHYRLSKTFLFILVFFTFSSCKSYLVGNMYAVSRYSGKMINMNYVISGNKITISGKSLANEYMTGQVLSPKKIKEMNTTGFIKLPSNGRRGYDYSFVRLVSTPSGEILDCFIITNSKTKFYKGGYGSCYNAEGDAFNLHIDMTTFPLF
jgi:hypothetical protein